MIPRSVLLLLSLSALAAAFVPSRCLVSPPPPSLLCHGHHHPHQQQQRHQLRGGALVLRPTLLFAHHPQKKAIKKIMHRRPKKHRPSDINRRNVNLNKSLHNFPGAPPDYTILTPEEFELRRHSMIDVWEAGSPGTESWNATALIPQELVDRLPQNRGAPVEPSPIPPRRVQTAGPSPSSPSRQAPPRSVAGHVQGRVSPDAARVIKFPKRMGVVAPPLSELRKEVKERQKLRLEQRQAWRGRAINHVPTARSQPPPPGA